MGICALACVMGTVRAGAEDLGNHLYDRFQLSGSGSMLWLGTETRVDAGDGSSGSDVDLEEDLGFTRTRFQPRVEFRWRPGRRHELGIGYQLARRTAEKTLTRTIEVGDTTFAAGAQVNSLFDSDNLFLTYRVALMAHERTQLGVGLGLGAFFFKIGVDALAGTGVDTVGYSNTTSFVGPTGALGVFGRFRAGDRWYFAPDVRYLRVEIDRITANVVEGSLVAQYFLSRKVGLEGGVGIKGVKVEIGPKTDGGLVDLSVSAKVSYTESQLRLGVVVPL